MIELSDDADQRSSQYGGDVGVYTSSPYTYFGRMGMARIYDTDPNDGAGNVQNPDEDDIYLAFDQH